MFAHARVRVCLSKYLKAFINEAMSEYFGQITRICVSLRKRKGFAELYLVGKGIIEKTYKSKLANCHITTEVTQTKIDVTFSKT